MSPVYSATAFSQLVVASIAHAIPNLVATLDRFLPRSRSSQDEMLQMAAISTAADTIGNTGSALILSTHVSGGSFRYVRDVLKLGK